MSVNVVLVVFLSAVGFEATSFPVSVQSADELQMALSDPTRFSIRELSGLDYSTNRKTFAAILNRGLKGDSPVMRIHSAWLLWKFEKKTEVISVISDLMCDKNSYVRSMAISALSDIASEDYSASCILVNSLDTFSEFELARAAYSLRQAGHRSIIPLLAGVFSKSQKTRLRSLTILGDVASAYFIREIQENSRIK